MQIIAATQKKYGKTIAKTERSISVLICDAKEPVYEAINSTDMQTLPITMPTGAPCLFFFVNMLGNNPLLAAE